MGTRVETLAARRGSTGAWVVAGAVVLLLAALGGGIALGRATETTAEPTEPVGSPAMGLASAEVVTAADANIVAWNAMDREAVAAAYAEEAIFKSLGAGGEAETVEGADAIAAWAVRFGPSDPWGLERVSDVVASGDLVTYGITYRCGGTCTAVSVLVFDEELRIARQWVIGS